MGQNICFRLHDCICLDLLEIKVLPTNAVLKARFYGGYFDRVICNDSGLYLDGLALDDERQPGLNIRSPRGKRLDDEEMIEYYMLTVCGNQEICIADHDRESAVTISHIPLSGW